MTQAETETQGAPVSRIKLSDSFLLAVAPGFGYLLVFVYQVGYAQWLGVPTEFIQVGLKDTLVAALLIIFLLLTAINFLDMSRSWNSDHPARQFAIHHTVAMVVLAGPVLLLGLVGRQFGFLWFLSVPLVLEVDILVLPLWSQRKLDGYWTKISSHHIRQRIPTTLDRLSEKYRFPITYICLAIIGLIYWAYSLGLYSAVNKEQYLMLPDSREIVLAVYNDKAILASYRGHKVLSSYRIIKLGDDANVRFQLEDIGHLQGESGIFRHV